MSTEGLANKKTIILLSVGVAVAIVISILAFLRGGPGYRAIKELASEVYRERMAYLARMVVRAFKVRWGHKELRDQRVHQVRRVLRGQRVRPEEMG